MHLGLHIRGDNWNVKTLVTVAMLALCRGQSCPSACDCVHPTVDCSGRNLAEVPEGIPETVETLLLSHNDICSLSGSEFVNFTALRELDLSHNCLSEFPGTTLQNNSDLLTLNLDSNGLSYIEENTFYSLSSLQELHLSNNSLQFLPDKIFHQSLSLSKLFLGYNSIDEQIFQSLEYAGLLQQLQLKHNKIQSLLYKILPAASQLRTLELNKNVISQIDSNSFIGMDSLQYLELSENKIDTIRREMFHPLSAIAGLNISHNPLLCSCDTKKFQDWINEDSIGLAADTHCYDPIFNKHINIETGDLEYLCNDTLSAGACNAPCASGAMVTMDTTVTGNMAWLHWDYNLISDAALTQIDCKAFGKDDVGLSVTVSINTTAILLENLQSDLMYTCCMLVYKCDLYTCDEFTVEDPVEPSCYYLPYIIVVVILSILLIILLIVLIVLVLRGKTGISIQDHDKTVSLANTCSPRTSVTVISMDSSFNCGAGTSGFQVSPKLPLRKRPLPNPNRESTYEHIPLDFEQTVPLARNVKVSGGDKDSDSSKDSVLQEESPKENALSKKAVVISETLNITSTYLTPVDSKEKIPRKPRRFVRPSKLQHKSEGRPTNVMIKSASFEGLNVTSNADPAASSSKMMKEVLTDPRKQPRTSSEVTPNSPNKLASFANVRYTCPENLLGEGTYSAGCYQEIAADI